MIDSIFPVQHQDVRKITYTVLYELIKKQKLTYKEISDICLSMLTPLEKDMIKNFLDLKGCYLTNVSQLDNGKNISIFIPEFEIKSYTKNKVIENYEFVFKKQDGSECRKVFPTYKLPRLIEFPNYYEPTIKECIGCHNGYGWEVIDVRIVQELQSYQELLY